MKRTFAFAILATVAMIGSAFAWDQQDPYLTITPSGERYQTTNPAPGMAITTDTSGNRWTTIDNGTPHIITVMPDGSHAITIRQ